MTDFATDPAANRTAAAQREARLAQALRDNLRRRKEQARARREPEPAERQPLPSDNPPAA
jgi:hypothetical protein